MIRCTIEILPGGSEDGKRVIGLIEIANDGVVSLEGHSNYSVVLKKTPPFEGALKARWKGGKFEDDDEGSGRARRGLPPHEARRLRSPVPGAGGMRFGEARCCRPQVGAMTARTRNA